MVNHPLPLFQALKLKKMCGIAKPNVEYEKLPSSTNEALKICTLAQRAPVPKTTKGLPVAAKGIPKKNISSIHYLS